MVHLGNSSDQIWYATLERDATRWGRDQAAGALRAEASPAVAGDLMLFPENRSGQLWHATFNGDFSSFDPNNPEVKDTEGNDLAPAHLRPSLAFSEGGWHLINKSPTSTRINYSYQGRLDPRWQYVGDLGDQDRLYLTKTRPAVAVAGNTLHVLHLGESSNRIYHARGTLSFDSRGRVSATWTEKRIGALLSRATPAVAIFDNRLHMVHLGDDSTNLWHSVYIPELNAWTDERISGQQSKAPPALAAFNRRLHMVHLGEDSNQIWWSRWREG
jgi:hypothetical protein